MAFFNLHTHNYTGNPKVLELVNQYPWEFDAAIPTYSIGIHPWHIDAARLENDLQIIDEKLSLPECLALGECGLDKRIDIPLDFQMEVFRKQIALAEKHQKPIVLHLVAAFDELIAIKKELKVTVPMIIHGFSKNEQLAKQLLDNGFYLSFGKYLLRSREFGTELKSVFQSVPNERFFLETDMVEETIEQVYTLAASYKNMTLETLQNQMAMNFKMVFKK